MNIVKKIKELTELVPYPIGHQLAKIPFSIRLGKSYLAAREHIDEMQGNDDYALSHFKAIFDYAKEKFPCYHKLYSDAGVLDLDIRSFEDVTQIPTIDKAWVRQNVGAFSGYYQLNTGGTSGDPMKFWVDKEAWAREWAHMHTIWEKLGYNYRDVKLTLRGRSHGKRALAYNPVHNEFVVSPYLPVSDFKDELLDVCRKRKPKWFHGYPSVIYQFILELEKCCSQEEIANVLGSIKGAFLSSEFPLPYMIKKFQQYGIKMASWYGHSEMCILAYDVSAAFDGSANFVNRYHPFTTYGLCEVEDGHLLGTSYHNFDMPLIRYDTGDLVEATQQTSRGLVIEFSIKEGRYSDFILDRNGKPFSVNSLIIGRHHHACDVAEYIQIVQPKVGEAVFLMSTHHHVDEPFEKLFDIPFMDMKFSMVEIDSPIRSAAGKLKMRVTMDEIKDKGIKI